MASYLGAAILIDHVGDEHDVRAGLMTRRVRGLTRWYGTLWGSAPWFDMQREVCTLRVGDREAPFWVSRFEPQKPEGPVVIEGTSGPPPFD